VTAVLMGALAVASVAPAWARRVPRDSTNVTVRAIDVGGVRVQRSLDARHPVHLRGNLDVNGKRVQFDDTLDLTVPRVTRAPSLVLGPGIHIESDDASIVRMGSDIFIDSTQVVDDAVVALFGNITVRGRVGGDVVAVLGSVTLEPGAVVDGDAVAVGGALEQAADATVHGQSVSLSFLPIHTGIPPLRALAIALFVAWLLAMLVGGALALLLQRRVARVAQTIAERAGWSLLLGILLPPLAVIAAVLLMVTLIGIPVACLLPLVYLFMLWIGTVAATYLLGCRATGRELGSGLGVPLLAGTLIVGVLFGIGAAFAGDRGVVGSLALFFPLLGVLLATSLSVIGSGAMIVSRFGTLPRSPASVTPPLTSAPPGVSPTPPGPAPGEPSAPPATI
jgi:hypothetical protein